MNLGTLRRLRFGLSTVLGLARRGFFIPYRYAGDLPAPGARASYAAVARLFGRHQEEFRATLSRIEVYADDLRAIRGDPPAYAKLELRSRLREARFGGRRKVGEGRAPAPRWDQDWFPRLDAAAAYAIVRDLRPQRIVEVGSGHSTRFLARAVADAGLGTAFMAIDPAPRANLAGLDVELVRAPVHRAGTAPFAEFASGDILFVDSSHILMPGSDVDWIVNHVMPELPAGVRVHFHDVFLPDDYPPEWAWRGYNEQLGVAALLHGGGYRPLFASRYVTTRMAATLAEGVIAELPLDPGARESSLWLEKVKTGADSRGSDPT